MKRIATIGIVFIALSAVPATGHEQHGHATYSAGEPGNASQPSRTIEVTMSEMEFNPSRIEVKRGEQIRFIVRNAGTEDHEFLLASTEDNLKHADAMKQNPRMAHDDPNGVRLAPKKSAEILWKFTKAGTFEFACLIPDPNYPKRPRASSLDNAIILPKPSRIARNARSPVRASLTLRLR